MPDRTAHRIWFELEPPKAGEPASVAEERAALASRLLARLLGPEDGPATKFWWNQREQRYCYGNAGGFVVLTDNGQWLNLSYLGREDLGARYTGPYV